MIPPPGGMARCAVRAAINGAGTASSPRSIRLPEPGLGAPISNRLMVGTPRCAASSGATWNVIPTCDSHVLDYSFNPLVAGWDGAARRVGTGVALRHSLPVVEGGNLHRCRPKAFGL